VEIGAVYNGSCEPQSCQKQTDNTTALVLKIFTSISNQRSALSKWGLHNVVGLRLNGAKKKYSV